MREPQRRQTPSRPTRTSRQAARATEPSDGRTVYLTFDDGPSAYTARIVGVLARTGSTATFFELGVNRPGRADAIHAILAEGSTIGNHSYDHPDLTKLGPAALRRQIDGGPRSRCFRPPYGATDPTVRAAIAAAGARQVLWTVDSRDWTLPGVAALEQLGRSPDLHAGSILLMHDGGGNRSETLAALPRLIAELQARGLRVRALPGCS